jgi:pterin-4a-carbinolamine dehydratase
LTSDQFNERVAEADRERDDAVRRVRASSTTFAHHPQLVLYDGRVEAAYHKHDRDIDALEAEFWPDP